MEQVLVLGGSYFIGRRIVEALLEAGYGVTTLNRGSRPAVPGVSEIHCNREDAEAMKAAKQVILAAVRGGRGRIPSDLRAQA